MRVVSPSSLRAFTFAHCLSARLTALLSAIRIARNSAPFAVALSAAGDSVIMNARTKPDRMVRIAKYSLPPPRRRRKINQAPYLADCEHMATRSARLRNLQILFQDFSKRFLRGINDACAASGKAPVPFRSVLHPPVRAIAAPRGCSCRAYPKGLRFIDTSRREFRSPA